VANLQRLLSLPEAVIGHLEAGRLSMGHARALIGQESAEALAERAVAGKLSVREVERLVRQGSERAARKPRRGAPRDPAEDADIRAVESHLEEFLGLPVRIATDADSRSGSVTIRYGSLDQLDLICQRLTGGAI
jgi:ParB family chromosome partitioning protein